MEIRKKDLIEVIDANGDLIGFDDIPKYDANADTQANGTTDQNVKIGQQPFRYDMLGRFGFTLMPFMEGEENLNDEQTALINDLRGLMFERYHEILKFYYKNPNRLKSDYRKMEDGTTDSNKEVNLEYANKIMKIVEKHFEKAFKEPKQIDESKVVEDKMVGKKNEDEISKKDDGNDVREKKLEKIAGLINKLEKKDIDKLINLLERK